MADLSKLSPLRHARARALRQTIRTSSVPLLPGIYQNFEQAYALTRDDVDHAVNDLANAGIITLQVRKGIVLLYPVEEADHGNSP